jgi:hypothetical protein
VVRCRLPSAEAIMAERRSLLLFFLLMLLLSPDSMAVSEMGKRRRTERKKGEIRRINEIDGKEGKKEGMKKEPKRRKTKRRKKIKNKERSRQSPPRGTWALVG